MPHYNVEMYLNETELLCNVVVTGSGLRIQLPFSTLQVVENLTFVANWRIKL